MSVKCKTDRVGEIVEVCAGGYACMSCTECSY